MKISALKSEIFLISLAIFCLKLCHLDWRTTKIIFNVVDTKHRHLVFDNFHPCWVIVYSIGKLAGAYFFGKLTQSLNYFKIMRYICLTYLVSSFLILIVLVSGQDFYASYKMLYFIRFLTALPYYVLPILSAMYLFDRYPPSQHILIAVSIIFAFFFSGLVFRLLISNFSDKYMIIYCVFAAIIPCSVFRIYTYVEKYAVQYSSHSKKIEKSSPLSFVEKLNCAFIAVGWSLSNSYGHYFLVPYAKNICIINIYPIGGLSMRYFGQIFGALLAIPICRKFGALKTLNVSLCCLFVFGVSIACVGLTKQIFFLAHSVFGFLSVSVYVSILVVLYSYYYNPSNLFAVVFLFAVGASTTMLICFGVSAFLSPTDFLFAGKFVLIACGLLCFIGANATQSQKKAIMYDKKLAA